MVASTSGSAFDWVNLGVAVLLPVLLFIWARRHAKSDAKQSNDEAREAKRIAGIANDLADEANKIAKQAKAVAEEHTVAVKKVTELELRRAFIDRAEELRTGFQRVLDNLTSQRTTGIVASHLNGQQRYDDSDLEAAIITVEELGETCSQLVFKAKTMPEVPLDALEAEYRQLLEDSTG